MYLAIILLFCHGYANGDDGVEIMHVPDLTDGEAVEEGSLWSFPDYAGDIWSRPALTGDWGGMRKKAGGQGHCLVRRHGTDISEHNRWWSRKLAQSEEGKVLEVNMADL